MLLLKIPKIGKPQIRRDPLWVAGTWRNFGRFGRIDEHVHSRCHCLNGKVLNPKKCHGHNAGLVEVYQYVNGILCEEIHIF